MERKEEPCPRPTVKMSVFQGWVSKVNTARKDRQY